MNPKENLPQQICDLCIVQLNVSYNFKRLALKNDFQIRQYMIENGINLSKEDDEGMMETTTALEIHQIHHNVITTNRYRQIAPTAEIRRNSTTSSVSGTSMLINGQSEATASNSAANFVTPRPMVRPIQIKLEPVDPDSSPDVTSSPSSNSEPSSIVTISSISSVPVSAKRPSPMVTLPISRESLLEKPKLAPAKMPAPLSVKLGRPTKMGRPTKEAAAQREKMRAQKSNAITKDDVRKSNRKVQIAIKEMKRQTRKKDAKTTTKPTKYKAADKKKVQIEQKPRGRPRKSPDAPKSAYKQRAPVKKSS